MKPDRARTQRGDQRAAWPGDLETHRQNFLESLRVRSYSPTTLKHYASGLDLFFVFLIEAGIEELREVDRATILAYQKHLQESHYTHWTVCARLQAVRRCCEHLEAQGMILLDPCAGLILSRRGTTHDRLPRTVLTQGEARAILETPDTGTPKGIRDRAILELFYATGIRREEMAALTVHDVDARQGLLRVRHGKFAKDRVVPLGETAASYLHEYITKVRALWTKRHREERALWLAPAEPHRRLDAQSIGKLVRESARAAGIARRVTPHVWRHTCATHLVANGAGLVAVQRLLGHRSLETTQIYCRVAVPEVKATHRQAHPRQRAQAPVEPLPQAKTGAVMKGRYAVRPQPKVES